MSEKQRPELPASIALSYEPYLIDKPGWWLILSDLHMPYHDRAAIEAAVMEGTRKKAVGVILNGDLLDYHEISNYDRDPTKPRYQEEREVGLKFFEYLRSWFPKEQIIYKEGNHEARLAVYIMRRAPALYGLEILSIRSLMELDRFGIEPVTDKRVIRLGKETSLIHGHEYTQRTVGKPVNPARGLYLRAKASSLAGHWHQTSEHHERSIDGRMAECFTTGCLCGLYPYWQPLNSWNHGFAMVRLDQEGKCHVRNLKIVEGKVI